MDTNRCDTKLLLTLERLLDAPAPDLRIALTWASDAVAAALQADKVDAFLHDPARDSLVAVGVSTQPLSALQKKLGLDVLPVSNGGRAIQVFQTGRTFVTGRLDLDEEELRGPKEALAIKSSVAVPLVVGGAKRGVIMITSQQPDFFSQEDVRFTESVARWVGVVAHRAELIEEIGRQAREQGRRAAAEEIVTVLAHDLRNLLSPIDGRLRMVRRRAEREARDADVRDSDIALRGLDRLGRMIADLLDLTRVEQGLLQLHPQPVDLVDVVGDAAVLLSGPEQPIEVRASEEVVVAADVDRVRQCLENILANAVKHSPQGSPIVVEVTRQLRDGGELAIIVVADEGPGIPHDVLPRIFDRFVTGPSSSGGLGLGLYFAKAIAVLHGGDLEVTSSPGLGARFTLTLPCCHER